MICDIVIFMGLIINGKLQGRFITQGGVQVSCQVSDAY